MISVANQSKLLSIKEEEVIDFMLSGFNFFDSSQMIYVSYVKDLDATIIHSSESLSLLKKMVDKLNFMISDKNSILEINAKNFSPTLFFLSDLIYTSIKKGEDLNNLFVLIPIRQTGSMFISSLDSILRLSDSFEGAYDIINFMDVIESVSRYEQWA